MSEKNRQSAPRQGPGNGPGGPIRIAGVVAGSSGDPLATAVDSIIGATGPICACADPLPRVGITVGMNEVVRYVETVKDPFCMASLGAGISSTGGLYGRCDHLRSHTEFHRYLFK